MAYPILIVDDEPQIRRLIQFLLSEDGIAAIDAPDGASALELVRLAGGRISLVLTDVHMAGMNGIELARSVGQFFPAIPVLFMSAIPADILGPEVPGSSFVQKPFLRTALITAIREALAGRRGDTSRSIASPGPDRATQAEGAGSGAGLFIYGNFQAADADERPPQAGD